ncbi:hypothetical protein HGA64_00580 [Candidatus Falkowbacteria bacterium]|nr:hypothetical protein [Candidatus Falkowbacteria bacterium]
MKKTMLVERALVASALSIVFVLSSLFGAINFVSANTSSQLNQTINAGVLATDIKNASEVTVASPNVYFAPTTFNFSCAQTATTTFASSTERVYVENPGADNNGWVLSLGAATTTRWHNGTSSQQFDWNDAGGAGCTDSDGDGYGGQMYIDPSTSVLATATAATTLTGLTKGSAVGFATSGSATLISAAAGSDDIGKWYFTNFSMSQKIPAAQANDAYTHNLTITLIGN